MAKILEQEKIIVSSTDEPKDKNVILEEKVAKTLSEKRQAKMFVATQSSIPEVFTWLLKQMKNLIRL